MISHRTIYAYDRYVDIQHLDDITAPHSTIQWAATSWATP